MVPICLDRAKMLEIWPVSTRKIHKIIANRCQVLRLKCTKFGFGWGSAPDHAMGAYSSPQTPYLDLMGPTSKETEGKGRERGGMGKEKWGERQGMG